MTEIENARLLGLNAALEIVQAMARHTFSEKDWRGHSIACEIAEAIQEVEINKITRPTLGAFREYLKSERIKV